ncbi:MAG: hypothetical protein LUE27_08270 [Clostridia bacterium]|nr:hypothetical protein [Clostridia bacterium]
MNTNEDVEDKKFPDADIYEVDLDNLLDMCAEAGVTAFMLNPDSNVMMFCLDQYEENREALDRAKGMVNYALVMNGIPGDMLFPAIVTYMNMKAVDCKMKDGTFVTGIAVSVPDNYTDSFAVSTRDGKVVPAGKENLKWVKMHLAYD